ncbi:hypothetical protein PILCRDRAFT_701282 [Piloderma croceum F 1598]|uniref:Uncharacterized protein n=1 Tax=Piloderma croceum (strain F 1598) TaxID=765440 RepID=A0A0C3BB51_PILCF|nr:hypothetical protein PILCRDRAFT_701282 [Piloderma croceum F 1598]
MDRGLERLARTLRIYLSVHHGLKICPSSTVYHDPTPSPSNSCTRSHFVNALYTDLASLSYASSTSEWGKVRKAIQAGTLDVVGCILEAWLANTVFAIGPGSSATGMLKEKIFSRRRILAERR